MLEILGEKLLEEVVEGVMKLVSVTVYLTLFGLDYPARFSSWLYEKGLVKVTSELLSNYDK